jgi:hypothetical protein
MNQSISSLGQMLEVENTSAFAEIVCPSTGILIWPTIRNAFFRFIISDLFYATNPLNLTGRRTPLHKIGLKTLHAQGHNFFNRPAKCPVLIYASGAGLLEKQGQSFNRYTGYFTDFFKGDTWSTEGIPWDDWPLTRANGKVSFWYPAIAYITLLSYVMVRSIHKKLAIELVNIAEKRAQDLLGWEIGSKRKKWLIMACARNTVSYPLRKIYFERLLHRVRPKLCIVEAGCYGEMAVFNAMAKEHGCVVAEFQHGSVTAGHDAYNVAPLLAMHEKFRQTMPDYFLGYGKWWNNQFNAPVSRIVIGNPHREAQIRDSSPGKSCAKIILIIGEGFETQYYLDLCSKLAQVIPGEYRITFRPHPLERDLVKTLAPSQCKGFDVDLSKDIFPALAQSYVVIAEVSTAAFDAVGLAERIFIWRTAKSKFSLPSHPFAELRDINDLVSQLAVPDAGKMSDTEVETIWATNWRERFKYFVEAIFSGQTPINGEQWRV